MAKPLHKRRRAAIAEMAAEYANPPLQQDGEDLAHFFRRTYLWWVERAGEEEACQRSDYFSLLSGKQSAKGPERYVPPAR